MNSAGALHAHKKRPISAKAKKRAAVCTYQGRESSEARAAEPSQRRIAGIPTPKRSMNPRSERGNSERVRAEATVARANTRTATPMRDSHFIKIFAL